MRRLPITGLFPHSLSVGIPLSLMLAICLFDLFSFWNMFPTSTLLLMFPSQGVNLTLCVSSCMSICGPVKAGKRSAVNTLITLAMHVFGGCVDVVVAVAVRRAIAFNVINMLFSLLFTQNLFYIPFHFIVFSYKYKYLSRWK